MTIDESYRLIQFIANKNQRGSIKPADFNMLAPIAQMSVINDRIGNVKKYNPHDPVPEYGWGMNEKTREELRGILNPPLDIPLTIGVGNIPTNFLYVDSIHVIATGKIVQVVPQEEFRVLANSIIKPPSADYPFCTLNTSTISVNPTSIVSVRMSYLKTPTTPVWIFTETAGEPVFVPTGSVNFELSPLVHFEICAKILQMIGVNLGDGDVTAFAQLAEKEGW